MTTQEPGSDEPAEPRPAEFDPQPPAEPAPTEPEPVAFEPPPVSKPRAALIAVITLAVIVCCASGAYRLPFEDSPPHLSTPSPDETSTEAPEAGSSASAASDDGEVAIVEQGHRAITDVAGEPQVTWGAMVENTSEEMVAVVQLKLAIRDADGESLNKQHGDYALDPMVPAVLPGQRTGVGDTVYVDGPGVEKVDIEVQEVTWYPLGNASPDFGELKVSEVKSEWVNKGEEVPYWGDDEIGSYVNERGHLLLRFRVDSGYGRIIERPGACAIFRLDGKIVGGAPVDSMNSRAELPPGWSKQYLKVKYGPPEKFDEAATKVYAYPSDGF